MHVGFSERDLLPQHALEPQHILSYEKYRIATISGSGPFTSVYPIDCNFIAGDYSTVAVASKGNSSAPVSLVLAE